MKIEVKQENSILFVKPLETSIEAENSRDFKIKLLDLINQGNKTMLIDFANVEFIDSSALGSLISVLKSLSAAQGQIMIYDVKAPVSRIFELTKLNQVFPMFASKDDAINALEVSKNAK